MTVPKVGDWLVFDDGFTGSPRYTAAEIVKAWPAKIAVSQPPKSRERHLLTAGTLFWGDEASAKQLADRLQGSNGLRVDEVTRANTRHLERVQKMIAEARGQ